MPVTDGDWQADLIGIIARSVMEMRQLQLMSIARSLVVKKYAPRIGSMTSALCSLA